MTTLKQLQKRIPNVPRHRLERLATLIDDISQDEKEASYLVETMPTGFYGTSRLDVKTKKWVSFCDKWGNEIDHG